MRQRYYATHIPTCKWVMVYVIGGTTVASQLLCLPALHTWLGTQQ